MVLEILSLLFVLLTCLSSSCSYANVSISREEDLEFERQLKLLNKPPVKTIQTNQGDIIDCVDIYKQPAFDHPFLKNHKLQLKPTSFPVGLPKPSLKVNSISLKSRGVACPSGTVPIKRTLKEDLIRTKNLSELPSRTMGRSDNIPHIPPGVHIVEVNMKNLGFPYYGASAYVSVYNLSLTPDQSSSTNLWITSGPPGEVNFITTGWKVSRKLNGDNLPRLFTYWRGSGKTGCHNTLCPGFVMTDNETTTNTILLPSSTPGGDIYEIKLVIFQDRPTGNWWLMATDENIAIGYWPKEIFSHLNHDGAQHAAWGGIANAGKDGISPPMGNGNMPGRHSSYEDICYFRQVRFVDNRNLAMSPHFNQTEDMVDKSGCYNLHDDKDWGDDLMRYSFMIGGPGGKCDG